MADMFRQSSILIVLTASVLACGGGGPAPATSPTAPVGVTTNYDVTYTDGTSVVEAANYESSLISVDEATGTYRFRQAEWLNSLQPGQVAIFAKHALVRVLQVTPSGDEVVVTTEAAALNEAIKDGRVGWNYAVDWQALPEETIEGFAGQLVSSITAPMAMAAGQPFEADARLAQVGPGLNWSGTVKGFEVEFGMTPAGDRVNLSLKAKRSLPLGTSVAASAEGWISDFTQETFLTYEQSQGSELSSKVLGLQGEITVEWHAAKLGEALSEITSFKVPVSLPFPFFVGPIPVVLKLMATLQVVPELSVQDASSGGKYNLKFNTDQGIEITGSSQTPFSDVKSVDIGVAGETVSAGWGPVAFALGIEFPRFEISVFGSTSAFITLKSYSTSQWTPGTTLTADIPPCQFGTSSLAAYAGYKVELLGFKLTESDPKELWKRDFTKYLNDKPCTLTGEPAP